MGLLIRIIVAIDELVAELCRHDYVIDGVLFLVIGSEG